MRKQYINFLKFVSILFVILIHLLSKAWNTTAVNSSTFKVLTFIDILFLVCVPIFVMCSGAIFLNRNDSIKKILFKYILKIYLIFIIFNSLYKIADIIMYQDQVINIKLILNILRDSILLKNIYHLWYLKVVIAVYLTTPLLKNLLKIKYKYIDFVILALLLIIFKGLPILIKSSSFITFNSLFGFTIYYFLGYLLDKYKSKKLIYYLIPLSIVSYGYSYITTINDSIITGSGSVKFLQYQSFNIMIISILFFALASYYRNIFEKDTIKKHLEFEAKYNFNIYLLHGFVIGLLSYLKVINLYDYHFVPIIFLYLIYVYVFSFICGFILKSIADKFRNIIKKSIM